MTARQGREYAHQPVPWLALATAENAAEVVSLAQRRARGSRGIAQGGKCTPVAVRWHVNDWPRGRSAPPPPNLTTIESPRRARSRPLVVVAPRATR